MADRSVADAFDRGAGRYDPLVSLNPGYHRHQIAQLHAAPGLRCIDIERRRLRRGIDQASTSHSGASPALVELGRNQHQVGNDDQILFPSFGRDDGVVDIAVEPAVGERVPGFIEVRLGKLEHPVEEAVRAADARGSAKQGGRGFLRQAAPPAREFVAERGEHC